MKDVYQMSEKLEKIGILSDEAMRWMEQIMAKGVNRIPAQEFKELGEIADIVKDLSEVKKNCAEACYYMEVTKAMKGEDKMGYSRGGGGGRMGYSGGGSGGGQGGSSGMGYHGEEDFESVIKNLKSMYNSADMSQREQLKMSVRELCM